MKKMFSIVLLIAAIGSGCKKSKTDTSAVAFVNTNSGSTYNYNTQSYAPVPSTGTYTSTATNKDTTINGRTYRVFTNSSGPNDYFFKSNTDYYQYGNLAALNTRVELLYLKDATIGTTWSETQVVTFPGFPTPLNVPLNYQVTEKGISYTVGSNTFTDVTHVKVTLGTISVMGIPITPTSDFNYYYARGIGRIYSRTKLTVNVALVGININMDDELKLNTYTLK